MIAGIEDCYRRFVVDGEPVATGLVAVGDAWACTNPSLGRGASIGLLHAVALRNVLRQVTPAEPDRLVREFDAVTEQTIGPWYHATLAFDRHRLAEIDADLVGSPYRTPDPSWAMTKALYASALRDPDALRAQSAIASMLMSPPEALAAPGWSRRSSPSVPTPRATRTPHPATTIWSRRSRGGRTARRRPERGAHRPCNALLLAVPRGLQRPGNNQ